MYPQIYRKFQDVFFSIREVMNIALLLKSLIMKGSFLQYKKKKILEKPSLFIQF